MASSSKISCPYCIEDDFFAPSESLLLDHIRLVHSQDPNFTIQCSHSGCSRTFRNFRTYQNHKLTHSPTIPTTRCEQEEVDESRFDNIDEHTEVQEGDLEMGSPEVGGTENFDMDHVQLYIAKWILKTRECRSLTRSAMQGVIEDTMSLLDFAASNIKTQVYAKLSNNSISSDKLSQCDEIFNNFGHKFFDGVATFHQQLKFYRENFRFVVS